MEKWSSCSINGISLKKLTLNGNIIWEKVTDSSFEIYFCTLSDDFDIAMEQFANLSLADCKSIEYAPGEIEFTSKNAGRPIILTKGDVEGVRVSFYVGPPVDDWFPIDLSEGVVSVDVEGEYDIPREISIEGNTYKVWTPDGEKFDYIFPQNGQCKLIIS